jgi:hypothetical protein
MQKTKKTGATKPSSQPHSPGIRLDLNLARKLMSEAVSMAGTEQARKAPEYLLWRDKIQAFSELVHDVGYRASIALLGSALVAKATNDLINPLSLRSSAQIPGAYNVRGPAESVLYPASLDHGFDIGSGSRNPLNGQTFNKLKSIDLTLKLRGSRGASLVKPLVALLHDISLLKSSADAVLALAAYVEVRRGYRRTYANPIGSARLKTISELSMAVSSWVAKDSEGGGRAQAAVGGLLDAVYGADRVRVGKLNEPDRKVPGDVCLLRAAQEPVAAIAIEVRDKIVTRTDILGIIQKLARTNTGKGAIVAIVDSQPSIDPAEYEAHAVSAGVQLEILYTWQSVIRPAAFWSDRTEAEIVSAAVTQIRLRAIQLELRPDGIDLWDELSLHESAPV